MKQTKKINFDFYQLSLKGKKNRHNVPAIFACEEYKPFVRDNNPILLHGTLHRQKDYVTGNLIHNQMWDLPSSYDNQKRKLAALKLTDEQGIAHSTGFLFDELTNILMLESSRNGVSLNNFCYFFENTIGETIYTTIVLNPDALRRFNSFDIISKLEFRIAKTDRGLIFNDGNKAFKQMTEIADFTNTNKLDMTLRASRNDSLRLSNIRTLIKELLPYRETTEVQKLVVTGREEGGHNTPIDLLKDRMRLTLSFDVNRFNDISFFNEKLRRMEGAYDDIRNTLITAYSN